MLVHHRLHLSRPHLEAADIDHPLQPVDREEIAVSIAIAEIAGPQKALAIELDEGAGVSVRPVPVALQHLRPVHDDLADDIVVELDQGVGIDDPRIGLVHGNAETLRASAPPSD